MLSVSLKSFNRPLPPTFPSAYQMKEFLEYVKNQQGFELPKNTSSEPDCQSVKSTFLYLF